MVECAGQMPGPVELLGEDAAAVDLSDYFAAGEAGSLTHSATVDDPNLASVSVAGSILTLTAPAALP